MKLRKISVFGLGYIGLPTAAAIAMQRRQVIGVDVNETAVNMINKGKIHIVEPELDVAVQAAVQRGFLHASLKPAPADAFIIAVPTPFTDGHQPDLSYIQAAATSIAPVLSAGNLVILESTSPVGTTRKLAQWLSLARPDLTFPTADTDNPYVHLAYCPERVLPGKIMYELAMNDRVVGGMTPACAQAALTLYKIFVKGECVVTDAATAELCKLTENAMRDVNIAFANELSIVCDKLGIDVWELIALANRHPRINILQPGPGVGGHCIAVDPWFIISQSPEITPLMATARQVNDNKPKWVLDKLKQRICEHLASHPGKRPNDVAVACFGLAFKADIDDLRESPALGVALEVAGSHPGPVYVVEPHVSKLPGTFEDTGAILTCADDALRNADILLMLVDHRMFKDLPVDHDRHTVLDTRGIWPRQKDYVNPAMSR